MGAVREDLGHGSEGGKGEALERGEGKGEAAERFEAEEEGEGDWWSSCGGWGGKRPVEALTAARRSSCTNWRRSW